MNELVVSVARDFSMFPGPRYIRQGKNSGEDFRNRLLEPNLKAGRVVVVDLDGTFGYGSSFLEEAFGGLYRRGFAERHLASLLKLKSADPSLIDEVEGYRRAASAVALAVA